MPTDQPEPDSHPDGSPTVSKSESATGESDGEGRSPARRPDRPYVASDGSPASGARPAYQSGTLSGQQWLLVAVVVVGVIAALALLTGRGSAAGSADQPAVSAKVVSCVPWQGPGYYVATVRATNAAGADKSVALVVESASGAGQVVGTSTRRLALSPHQTSTVQVLVSTGSLMGQAKCHVLVDDSAPLN